MLRKMRVGMFVVVCLLLALSTVRAQDDVPRFEEDRCPFKKPDGVDVDCGWLITRETHADEDSPEIRLAVAIYRATGRNAESDPLIYLDGGPGGPSLESWSENWSGSAFEAYSADRDVILIDQRGTGYSEPSLFCDETNAYQLDTLDDELSDEAGTEGYYDAVHACFNRLEDEGINLDAYNSAEMAADIADLRVALGYDEVDLLGISYGTRIALTIMRDHPEGIRSVIIDAVVPVQANDSGVGRPAVYEQSFQTLFDACADNDACNEAFPDLEQLTWDTAQALEDDPQTIQITLDSSQETVDMLLDGDQFIGTLFSSLYSVPTLIPQMVYNASQGDYDLIALLNGYIQDNTISVGAYYSVRCHDEEQFNNPDDIIAEYEDYPEISQWMSTDGHVEVDEYFKTCRYWTEDPAGDIENEPVVSDIPTLVMTGQFDPVTPPPNGELAAETLENSFVFVIPGEGHGASLSSDECVQGLVSEFLSSPEDEPDGSCLEDIEVTFDIPVTEVTLEDYSNGDLGINAVIPRGWEEVDSGFIVAPTTGSTVLWYLATPDSVLPNIMEYLTESTDIPEVFDTVSAGRIDWTIYRFDVTAFRGFGTVAEGENRRNGDHYYIIVIAGTRTEDTLLYDELLLPAIDAFEP
ncbi:MAG: alpha/beta hydrolase [Anaerolineae bacterium]